MAMNKKKKPVFYSAIVALGLAFGGETLNKDAHQGAVRWETKVLADDEAHDINFIPQKTTLHDLVNSKTEKSVDGKPRQPIEKKTYTIECRIAHFLYEDDGDVHLVLCFGKDTMIGEIPLAYFPEAEESGFKKKFINARKQFHKVVDNDKFYYMKTLLVTGVGFVDFAHGQTGHAPNNLELHPILSIVPKKK